MVQDRKIQQFSALNELLREMDICFGGIGISRGMVVKQNERRSICFEGMLENKLWICNGAGNAAKRDLSYPEDSVCSIHEQTAKGLAILDVVPKGKHQFEAIARTSDLWAVGVRNLCRIFDGDFADLE